MVVGRSDSFAAGMNPEARSNLWGPAPSAPNTPASAPSGIGTASPSIVSSPTAGATAPPSGPPPGMPPEGPRGPQSPIAPPASSPDALAAFRQQRLARNNQGPGAPVGPVQGPRPIDALKEELRSAPGPAPAPALEAPTPGPTLGEFRQKRLARNAAKPQAAPAPTTSPRQFGDHPHAQNLMAAHKRAATGHALSQLAGPGGWSKILAFGFGAHLNPNTTPYGREAMHLGQQFQRNPEATTARMDQFVPKPPKAP